MKSRKLTPKAFLKRVKDAIEQYDMLQKGDKVLVAVSGGPDSVCLLKALIDIRNQLGIDIVVGNMDHCMRGSDSSADSDHVKKMAKQLGLECIHKKVDVKRSKMKGCSLEEKAREKRYDFLKKAAVKSGCNVIATGHTMDDQAETVLIRIIYGGSMSGMSGIPPVRQEGDLNIVRPLIRVNKKEILDFVKSSGMKYVIDKSNCDTRFIRNKIRHDIFPILEKCNPRIKRTLVNISDNLREDLGFINDAKEKALKSKGSGIKGIEIKDILLQPKAVRKEVFKELFKEAGGNIKKLTYRHWMDVDKFLRSAEGNKSLDLPGQVKVIKQKKKLIFTR